MSKFEVTLDYVAKETFKAHENIMKLHFRAMACHCECLAMNSANMMAIVMNQSPPYSDDHYSRMLQKWGLTDEKGEPNLKLED